MRRVIVDKKDPKKFYEINRTYTTENDKPRWDPDEWDPDGGDNPLRNYLFVLRHGPETYSENYDRTCRVDVERFDVFTQEHYTETHDGKRIYQDFLVKKDIGERVNEIITSQEFQLSRIFNIVIAIKNDITDEEVAGLLGATIVEEQEKENAS